MKRLSMVMGCALLILGAPAVVRASNPVTVYVNGQIMTFDQPPEVRSGRVFVPLRAIFQQLGATVVYSNGAINATSNGRTIALQIGSNAATVNGQRELLDVAPYVEGARTLVPLRFVATALGARVNWNPANNAVTIDGAGAGAPVGSAAAVYFTSTSPTGNAGAQTQPQLLFSLSRPTRMGLFSVWVDGRTVTQYVQQQSPRSFGIRLPYPLQPMQHRVRVAGQTIGGVSFTLSWTFVTTP